MSSKYTQYTEEQREFLKSHVTGYHYKETAELFNKHFDRQITWNAVKAFCVRNKLSNGLSAKFDKGHTPFNKGQKQTDYMSSEAIEKCRRTTFKKGNMPVSHKPVGSTRISADGYTEIKIAEPNKWRTMNRYVWEQHYGMIPKGKVILHKDGDKLNDDINNLMMVDRSVLLPMNKIGLEKGNIERNEVVINISQIYSKINEINKK